jgi:hypothetical protein
MLKMPLKQLYGTLVTQSLRNPRDEEELLLFMLLIHTYEIHLKIALIEEFPDRLAVPIATQRYAAEVVSVVWPEQDEKRSANYWYRRFQVQFGNVAKAVMEQSELLSDLATRLESCDQVDSVLPAKV